MGIAPYKTFTFDGVSSSAYGVYLTGEGVFNAPERDVEMIEVYGRNGDFALDHGRFRNITVTYRAGIFDATESNFVDKVSAVRNWLCSKVGYCRLEDEYNPNEYRMAVYSSGLNVEHDFLIAGEFEITFICKPQRWLTSGETAVTVADGGELNNPTLFEASPLLELYGYGTLNLGSETIIVDDTTIGDVILVNGGSAVNFGSNKAFTFDDTFLNVGDEITFGALTFNRGIAVDDNEWPDGVITDKPITVTVVGNCQASGAKTTATPYSCARLTMVMGACSFNYGTANTETFTANYAVEILDEYSGNKYTKYPSLTVNIVYDGNNTITFSYSDTLGDDFFLYFYADGVRLDITYDGITANSSKSAITPPLYIDLDIGEAYIIESGVVMSVNNSVQLPPKLPTLAPGTTLVTYDNTYTQVNIVPRWWRV